MQTTPRWSLDDTRRRGRVALLLATQHQAALEPRLDPGLLAQLAADLATLGDGAVSRVATLNVQKTATASERELAEEGHDLVLRVRAAVKASPVASDAVRTALGIGDGLKANVTSDVVAALERLVAQGAALAPFGVLPSDLAEAASLASALRGADGGQGSASDARLLDTSGRAAVQVRVELAIRQIATRGPLAFPGKQPASATLRAAFDRLDSDTGPSAQDEAPTPSPSPTPDPTPTPTPAPA